MCKPGQVASAKVLFPTCAGTTLRQVRDWRRRGNMAGRLYGVVGGRSESAPDRSSSMLAHSACSCSISASPSSWLP